MASISQERRPHLHSKLTPLESCLAVLSWWCCVNSQWWQLAVIIVGRTMVGKWDKLHSCLSRIETAATSLGQTSEKRVELGFWPLIDLSSKFPEDMLYAWFPVLYRWGPMVNPTERALPLKELVWPPMQSYFTLIMFSLIYGFQMSTMLYLWGCSFCVSATSLGPSPINQFVFLGHKKELCIVWL